MFEIFSELKEDTLKQRINDFNKLHKIINIQYSTTPYMNSVCSKIYHSVLIEYQE